MKVVAIMPIKMINERCPGKNTRLLGSKPLLWYELESLYETRLCDSINVYCSDDNIKKYLPSYAHYIKRPTILDSPMSNFNQIFELFSKTIDADIYIYAHATAPFISTETMIECINAVKNGGYDSSFCAIKLQDFLWQDNEPLNFDASNLPRTQDLKPIYQETSGIYVFKKQTYEKYHRRIGVNPFIKEVSIKESVDIDTPEDFLLAEALLNIKL